ncbi:hypothetical protein ACIGO9_28825 [Nocardia asteroides]|uniref:hypothetical protein n=1 Tax=Nocardia asteroides TaxID=1824 RepID=UPI0037C55607
MSKFSPITMVSPQGVEVVASNAVTANDLACAGYRTKIVVEASAVTEAAVKESATETPENKISAKPVRPAK